MPDTFSGSFIFVGGGITAGVLGPKAGPSLMAGSVASDETTVVRVSHRYQSLAGGLGQEKDRGKEMGRVGFRFTIARWGSIFYQTHLLRFR